MAFLAGENHWTLRSRCPSAEKVSLWPLKELLFFPSRFDSPAGWWSKDSIPAHHAAGLQLLPYDFWVSNEQPTFRTESQPLSHATMQLSPPFLQTTFNSIVVGVTATESLMGAHEMMPPGWLAGQIRDTSAAERIGVPEDIAYIVGFLSSEEGRWVNGTAVSPNGGNKLLMGALG